MFNVRFELLLILAVFGLILVVGVVEVDVVWVELSLIAFDFSRYFFEGVSIRHGKSKRK